MSCSPTTETMLEWLIIGGGVHGTHLSHVLVNGAGVDADRVVVLDPYEEPLWRWKSCSSNTGMRHLRSPAVHHIGLEPMELIHFSRSSAGQGLPGFRPPYDRPSTKLFDAHCEHVCEAGGLYSLRRQGQARGLSQDEGRGFVVETDRGRLRARRVVLAMGSGEQLRRPDFCDDLEEQTGAVWHVFDDDFELDHFDSEQQVGVVGLGISAGQVARELVEKRGASVDIVARHDVRVHQFDSPPCWLGPKCQVPLRRCQSYEERRRLIEEARQCGSMPRDVARPFEQLVKWGQITKYVGDITGAKVGNDGQIEMKLSGGEQIEVDALVLATGFESRRPDQGWLADPIESMGLRCAECGAPIVDNTLQWSPGLHVSGALAELELGPAARNIAGARMTSRRLAPLARAG